jgi:hypothetical protein
VFARKNDHGAVKHKHIVYAAFLRAFAFVMNDACIVEVIVFEAA